ncbi:TPR repeat-containing protein YrrB [Planctomycetes bacterium Pan216]|uniref:TPR repeat-containing protein YrrB n=1 Tax=Kolteria novifilia TaxID=2527975 RepID=A0A518B757_9BACT|nr:TPR repeat-containing protein YrrB [Planctomycetes bacterium Pan216]
MNQLRRQAYVFLAVILTLVGGFLGWLGWQWFDSLPAGLDATYAGTDSCIKCHQTQYDKWRGSHHDLAMQEATEETVLGNFTDQTVEIAGSKARFFMKDGRHVVETEGPGGATDVFSIPFTFGVEPLQQYLVEFPEGRLQVLPFAWDTGEEKWIHLTSDQGLDEKDWLYWCNGGMAWNHQCADCHSTDLQKNFDPASGSYHTTFNEVNVGCEACHGPGSLHLEIVDRGRVFWDRRYGTGLANLKSKNTQVQIDTCGKCHARRQVLRPGFTPGDSFLDYYMPELFDTESYYPDGQILEEDYVYGSFHLSLMYHKGVKCTDCHDPHSTKLLAQGNALCIRCHQAGKYDTPAHTHHLAGSKGALCVECHMPETTYMMVDPRRDHAFRIPRPDLTMKLGIPNACNRCHDDKDAEWSQKYVTEWYGTKPKPLRIDFAETIAAGRQGLPEGRASLLKIVRDQHLPSYLRASALSLLQRYPPDEEIYRVATWALDDEHPLVRALGVRLLTDESMPLPSVRLSPSERIERVNHERVAAMAALLSDESFVVRCEAARALARIPRQSIPEDKLEAFDEALAALEEGLQESRDIPLGNVSIGSIAFAQGDLEKAETYYKKALEQDPGLVVAYELLGRLHINADRADAAIETYRDQVARIDADLAREDKRPTPNTHIKDAYRNSLLDAHYRLGMLLADDPKHLEESLGHFEKALEIEPAAASIRIELGMMLLGMQRLPEAERHLRAAYEVDPNRPDLLWALANIYLRKGDLETSRSLLRRLLELQPGHQGAMQLLGQLRQAALQQDSR